GSDDGAADAVGAGAVGAGFAGARCAPPFGAASTSAFTIRPCGPEPLISVSSTPDCDAMRRASGDAKTRAPSACADAAACVGAGAALGVGIGVTVAAGFAAAGAAAGFAGAAGAGAAGAAGLPLGVNFSFSSRSWAMTVLTFTPSVPSATAM